MRPQKDATIAGFLHTLYQLAKRVSYSTPMSEEEIEKLKQQSGTHLRGLFEDMLRVSKNIAKELPKETKNKDTRDSLAATIRRTRRVLRDLQ